MRRRRKGSSVASGVTIPVTPMLDMTFQLLFFLILTFKADALAEGEVKLALPGNSSGSLEPEPPSPPAPSPEGLPNKLTVVVRSLSDGSGGISALTVRTLEGEWAVGDVAGLRQWLKVRHQEWPEPARVQIQPDGRLKYAFVMDVFDACRNAGMTQVGFDAPDS